MSGLLRLIALFLLFSMAIAAPKRLPNAMVAFQALDPDKGKGKGKGKGKAAGKGKGAGKDAGGAAKGKGKGRGKGNAKGQDVEEVGRPEEVDNRKKSSHWCMTAFQFDELAEQALKDWVDTRPDLVRYIIVGHEHTPTTGRLHLQAYVQFKDQVRLSWLKKNPVANTWCWYTKYKKSTPEQAAKYCTKENDFWERGVMSHDNGEEEKDRWAHAASTIRQHKSWDSVLRDDSLARYISKSMGWAQAVFNSRREPKPYVLNLDKPGFTWQGKVARFVLGTKADDRHIVWIVDDEGCRGKSRLRKFLTRNCKAMWVPLDLKSASSLYDGQTICVVDVPREETFSNYKALEQLKDSEMIQTKYEVYIYVDL